MPRPFTTEDYTARLARATADASAAGLTGLVVAPGPDLLYLSDYQPTAITERLTALVLSAGREPALIVPKLERPDAEKAAGAPALRLVDWTDGEDPYATAVPLLDPAGRYGVSDNAWAMHLLGLQAALPGTGPPGPCTSAPTCRTRCGRCTTSSGARSRPRSRPSGPG